MKLLFYIFLFIFGFQTILFANQTGEFEIPATDAMDLRDIVVKIIKDNKKLTLNEIFLANNLKDLTRSIFGQLSAGKSKKLIIAPISKTKIQINMEYLNIIIEIQNIEKCDLNIRMKQNDEKMIDINGSIGEKGGKLFRGNYLYYTDVEVAENEKNPKYDNNEFYSKYFNWIQELLFKALNN